jgi:superfamily II DNA or RNA helicase
MTPTKLRPWQEEASRKALDWLIRKREDRHFLINAAPGAGKTIAASAIARQLLALNEIDRVIVIAPRREVVNQWGRDFQMVTGRYMSRATGGDGDIEALEVDICATWAAVQGLMDAFQAICRTHRTLVICDEHHHAAITAAWGDNADSAFANATFVLVLTGTPIRADGAQSVWLAYDDAGAIEHPDDGTYTLTYGEAVDLGYCRPVTFHRHEGRFNVDIEDGSCVEVSSREPAVLSRDLARIPGLQKALSFYRLACTPQFASDGSTPRLDGYQATMLEEGSGKLSQMRHRMPEAGGLVIAHSIKMASYMADLLERIEGERPLLVHSQSSNAENQIRAFRNTDKRWIVSVAMISEGVDIRRLRVLVYLPHATTELAFRQAIGRIVRTMGPGDDTRAYVVMPSFDLFERHARRIEDEMPSVARRDELPPRTKKCPACLAENPLGAGECNGCGHTFPERPTSSVFRPCETCGALNSAATISCHACGADTRTPFVVSLDEALRTGAIVRGMDLSEEEVRAGEDMADRVRDVVFRSGDAGLIHLLSMVPDEQLARLRDIMDG